MAVKQTMQIEIEILNNNFFTELISFKWITADCAFLQNQRRSFQVRQFSFL